MFSCPLARSPLRFFLDFFLSSDAKLVEDFVFLGLRFSTVPSSQDPIRPESEDLSLTNDLSDMLLFDFLCTVGWDISSFSRTRRG